jgi:hypothetical protein
LEDQFSYESNDNKKELGKNKLIEVDKNIWNILSYFLCVYLYIFISKKRILKKNYFLISSKAHFIL